MGMRVVCAKFLHPTAAERASIPDPFGRREPSRPENKRYTSSGPSLADVTAASPAAAAVAMAMADVFDPGRKGDERDKGKDRTSQGRTLVDAGTGTRDRSRLLTKGSAPSALGSDPHGASSKVFSMTADRRPSLPLLSHEAALTSPAASTQTLATTSGIGSSTLSFSAIFGSGKDKEEKKREKEQKKAEKAAKEKMKKDKELDAPDATTSIRSWKISRPKKTSAGAVSSRSTTATADEDALVQATKEKEVRPKSTYEARGRSSVPSIRELLPPTMRTRRSQRADCPLAAVSAPIIQETPSPSSPGPLVSPPTKNSVFLCSIPPSRTPLPAYQWRQPIRRRRKATLVAALTHLRSQPTSKKRR